MTASNGTLTQHLKRVLIVDDEPEIVEILRERLTGRYEVETTTSSVTALEIFGRWRPDAVFLDINMPLMNGTEVLKLLHQIDKRIPVIMITANTSIDVAEECLKSGAFSYIPKPFNLVYIDHLAAAATGMTSEEKDRPASRRR